MKYSYLVEGIPVIRPSTWNSKELTEGARILSGNYRTGNIVFGFKIDSDIPWLDPSKDRLKDQWWLEFMKSGRWRSKGWNYDPGTTADVYLRRGGVGAYYLGEVVFMKGGKKLGFWAIGGNRYLVDYYRDMKKLGIYIP